MTSDAQELRAALGNLIWLCVTIEIVVGAPLHIYCKRVSALKEYVEGDWSGLKFYMIGDLQLIPNKWMRYLAYGLRPVTFLSVIALALLIIFMFVSPILE